MKNMLYLKILHIGSSLYERLLCGQNQDILRFGTSGFLLTENLEYYAGSVFG